MRHNNIQEVCFVDTRSYETFVPCAAADHASNLLVHPVMLAGGGKRLFSSEAAMEKYLLSLRGNQPPYVIGDALDIDNRLSCERIGCANIYTFSPRWISCRKRVIYFCGGAFVREPAAKHIKFVDKLAAAARAEISVFCYPKAPTYTYADTYELAARYYSRLAEKYGAENIIFMGDGAGGSIALSLCAFLKEAGLPAPGGVAAVSPVCDPSLSNPALEGKARRDPALGIDGLSLAIKKWCGARTPLDKLLNPMDMEVSALPELLLLCGTEELLAPDVRLFAKHVNLCGGKAEVRLYKGMYHSFPLYPLKASAAATEYIAAWLNR